MADELDEHRREDVLLAGQAIEDLLTIATDPKIDTPTRIEAWRAIRIWETHRTNADSEIAKLEREWQVNND